MVVEALRGVYDNPLFEVTAAPYLVLDTDLRIRAANGAYLGATGRHRDELIGEFMFDAFPDPPYDDTATGVRNLNASLERVLSGNLPDQMGVQRYDIIDAQAPTGFRLKTWSPVNSPVRDADGRVVGALHHVEDITGVYELLDRDPVGELRDGPSLSPATLRRMVLAIVAYQRQGGQAYPDLDTGAIDTTDPRLTSVVERSRRLRQQSRELRQIAQWLRAND